MAESVDSREEIRDAPGLLRGKPALRVCGGGSSEQRGSTENLNNANYE